MSLSPGQRAKQGIHHTGDGKSKILRVFGNNSAPRRPSGTNAGGNASYKLPGDPETLQDPGKAPTTYVL